MASALHFGGYYRGILRNVLPSIRRLRSVQCARVAAQRLPRAPLASASSRWFAMTDTEEKEELFQKLIFQMKDRIKSNDVAGAIYVAKKALKIRDSEKLQKRIKKMEDYITAMEEESAEEREDMCDLGDGFYLTKELHDILYSYQREGVRWLWGLFKKGKGGILADDMGCWLKSDLSCRFADFLPQMFEKSFSSWLTSSRSSVRLVALCVMVVAGFGHNPEETDIYSFSLCSRS